MKSILFAGISMTILGATAQVNAQTQTNSIHRSRNHVAIVEADGKTSNGEIKRLAGSASGQRENLKRRHSDYAVHYNQGVKHALAGRYEDAVAAFKRAIALDPGQGDAYFNLGDAYSNLGRWTEAVEAYKQAIFLRPKDGQAHNNLGIAYFKAGSYGNAFDALTEATRIHPKWAEPHYNLSNVYSRLGRHEAAAASYKEAVRLRPDYATNPPSLTAQQQPTSPSALPSTSRSPENSSGAVIRTALSASNAPRTPAVATDTLPTADNVSRSAATIVTAPPQPEGGGQRDAEAYYYQGVKHGRSKQYEEAVKAFRQATLIKPNYIDAYFGLGQSYSYLGRWDEAIAAYEQVLRVDPKDREAYYRLGEAYVKLRAQAAGAPIRYKNDDGAAIGEVSRSENRTAVGEKVSGAIAVPPTPLAGETGAISAPGTSSVSPRTSDPLAATLDNGAAPKRSASSESAVVVDPISFYRVGAGDVLDIRSLNQPTNRSTLFTVTAAGLLDYPPFSEPLQVAGLTPDEIRARLAAELKRQAIDENPEVVVAVREYVSHAIIVSGLVSEPGTKVLRREAIPLYVVVADAQPRPEAGQVVIDSRATGQKTTVDITDQAAMKMLVYPSDVVTVEARPQQFFYIGGQINSPGQKNFHRGMTLTQAILASGGDLSKKSSVKIMRQDKNGLLTTSSYNLRDILSGKTPDPILQPDDRIGVEP